MIPLVKFLAAVLIGGFVGGWLLQQVYKAVLALWTRHEFDKAYIEACRENDARREFGEKNLDIQRLAQKLVPGDPIGKILPIERGLAVIHRCYFCDASVKVRPTDAVPLDPRKRWVIAASHPSWKEQYGIDEIDLCPKHVLEVFQLTEADYAGLVESEDAIREMGLSRRTGNEHVYGED